MRIFIFSKTIKAAIIIIALTFSANTYATAFSSGKKQRHERHRDERSRDEQNRREKDQRDQESGDDHSGGNTSVPLDGGLSVLLLGAAAFGVKKLRGNKKDEI